MRTWMAVMVLAAAGWVGCAQSSYAVVHNDRASLAATKSKVDAVAVGIRPGSDIANPTTARLLHVRLLAFDASGEPWRVSPGEQRLRLPDGRVLGEAGGSGQLPVEVAPGRRAAVDLYFPLPAGADTTRELDGFTLDWRVDQADRPLVGSAIFGRAASGPIMPCGAVADSYCLSGYSSLWTPSPRHRAG
jgi:hypothetical protein